MEILEIMKMAAEKGRKQAGKIWIRYDMKGSELSELYRYVRQNPYSAIVLAFDYGKVKGMRLQKKLETQRKAEIRNE